MAEQGFLQRFSGYWVILGTGLWCLHAVTACHSTGEDRHHLNEMSLGLVAC